MGSGRLRVQARTTSLSSAQPIYEERSCNECAGTGKGQRASADDLRRYFSEPSKAPEDLFALGKTVAATCRRPRAKVRRTEQVQVSYGFLGRKTRTESVIREAEADYWVLATKELFERELTDEEVDDHEIVFCLAIDGSFRQLRRTQHSYHDRPFGWSDWEPRAMSDLDHFMVEFDFKGHARRETSSFLTHTNVVSGILENYLNSSSGYWSLNRLYPKGVGLYVALRELLG
jgi:hypothetical protein